MKTQVLLLLGLFCFSAIAAITNTHTVVINGVTYGIGKDTFECGVTKDGTVFQWTSGADASTCTPKGLFAVGTDLWAVIQVDSDADIFDIRNNEGGASAEWADTLVATGEIVDNSVAVVKIQTTTTNFGKFLFGTLIAARDQTTNWGGFTITDVIGCNGIIEIKGDTAAGDALVSSDNSRNSAATGTGVYIDFDTSDNSFTAVTESSDECDFSNIASVEVNSVTYQIGKKGNDCGISRNDGTNQNEMMWTTNADSSTQCKPIAIADIGTDIWVVLQVSSTGNIFTTANSVTSATTEYSETLVPIADIVDNTVAVVRIQTSTTNFGKFQYGTYIAAQNAAGDTWDGFEVSAVTDCDTTIQIKGDTATGYALVGSDETRNADATGDNVYIEFDTSDESFIAVNEEGAKECSGLILSVASAILTFGLLAF